MAKYLSENIKEILTQIKDERIILPAMQRSFVWPAAKIYNLFDSLMRDYPIGTFLFWKIDKTIFHQYMFNSFIQDYIEQKGKLQRGSRATSDFSDYEAVLDGQQRLTSLYIGTCGKEHLHLKGKKWNDPTSFVDKFLCIDILNQPTQEEKYSFQFCSKDEIEKVIDINNRKSFWVKVNTVFEDFGTFEDASNYTDNLDEKNVFETKDKRIAARKMLEKLHDALTKNENINYYSAKDMELTDVVDIFVRVNSGGEKLSASDLMLSVAAGELADKDVHNILQDAVNEINNAPDDPDTGFIIDKETILTAGLMFTGAESMYLSNSANYTHERMNSIFKDHWESIIDALKNTVTYIEYIGFVGSKLSKSIILPIAYYFYHNNLSDNHKTSSSDRACCDRIFIRQWLLRSILKDVFMEGTAATLLQFRNILSQTKKKHFPLEELMEKEIKKPLTIGDDQIEIILELKYGDSKIVPLFDELLHRTPEQNIHVDHIWAKTILNSKSKLCKLFKPKNEDQIKTYKDGCNSIANLQLLNRLENTTKSDTEYDKWIRATYPDAESLSNYQRIHFIPKNISYKIEDLENFWEKRKALLSSEIKKAFPNDFNKIVERYNLKDKI